MFGISKAFARVTLLREARLLLVVTAAALGCAMTWSSSARAASSVSINGITFQFDSDYETGTFVDGMPWVVEKGAGVRVTRMTPDYSSGRHGYEVNPKTKELLRGEFGCNADECDLTQLDSRLVSGRASHWVEPTVNNPLPKTFPANSSILKVISYTAPGDCFSGRDGAPARTCIDHAAVLTVLSSRPPADSFRPPYPGTQKPIFSARDIDIDGRLPRLPDTPAQPSLSGVLAIFGDGDVLVNHISGWIAERAFPRFSTLTVNATRTDTYGCQVGIQHNSAMLRSMQSGTASQKRDLVYRLVQRGIDAYYVTKAGKSWDNDGGCVTPGWKPLVLYSGYLLMPQAGASDMVNRYDGGSDEDRNTTLGSDGEGYWGIDEKTCFSGVYECSNSDSNNLHSCTNRDAHAPKYGTHPAVDRCGRVNQPTLAEQRAAGAYSATFYQQMSGVRVGSAAVARILGLEDEWDDKAFFSYIDRWATPPWNYYCETHCSSYLVEMHKVYGCNSRECADLVTAASGGGGSHPPPEGQPPPTQAPAAPLLLE